MRQEVVEKVLRRKPVMFPIWKCTFLMPSGLDISSRSVPSSCSAEKFLPHRRRSKLQGTLINTHSTDVWKKFLPLKFCNKEFSFSSDWLGGNDWLCTTREFSLRQIGVRDPWLGGCCRHPLLLSYAGNSSIFWDWRGF